MFKSFLMVSLVLCVTNAKNLQIRNESETNELQKTLDTLRHPWFTQLKSIRRDLRHCFKAETSIWQCFKEKTIQIFKHVMTADTITLYEGVRLIRKDTIPSSSEVSGRIHLNGQTSLDERKDFKYLSWFDKIAQILARALNTHNLQINLAQVTESYMRSMDENDINVSSGTVNPSRADIGTARGRRHRYNMIITMMFGVTALGAILVPMGFQMLSIVSGKALLLAKMALLLASINGLKRVANSGLHYGLYHVPGEHYGGYYDRGDSNHPRNVPIPMAMAQPSLDIGLKK